MNRLPSKVPAVLAIAALALLVGGCSSGTATAPSTALASAASSPSPAASGGTLPTAVPTPDPGLPEGWPSAIPGYPGGRLLSAVVSEDGSAVNGAWVSDASAEESWSTMEALLRDAGYMTTAEAGGVDMLVQDENQRSDNYVKDGFEVNIVVLPGEQTTVFVNGSVS